MREFGFGGMSIRGRLALILGITIFALAAARALGLSQLGGFLERFVMRTVLRANSHPTANSIIHSRRNWKK